MSEFSITIEGAEELIAKIETLKAMNHVKATIAQQGVLLQRHLRKYPKKVYSPNPLIKSDPRVRRGFFYHLKHGNIQTPYKRTRRLAGSWTVTSGLNGFTAYVQNNMPYAELVQGADNQVTRHKWSGWLTEKGALDLYRPQIEGNIRAALEKEVANV